MVMVMVMVMVMEGLNPLPRRRKPAQTPHGQPAPDQRDGHVGQQRQFPVRKHGHLRAGPLQRADPRQNQQHSRRRLREARHQRQPRQPQRGDPAPKPVTADQQLAVPRSRSMEDPVQETDRHQSPERPGVPLPQRAQGPGKHGLRLALAVLRPGPDRVQPAPWPQPEHRRRDQEQRRPGDHPPEPHRIVTFCAKRWPSRGTSSASSGKAAMTSCASR